MSEKVFEPTADKVRKALGEGKTKRSQLISSSILILAIILLLKQLVVVYWVRIQMLLECIWSDLLVFDRCARQLLDGTRMALLALAIISLVIPVLVHILQVGVLWLPAAVLPKAQNLSWAKGAMKVVTGIRQVPVIVLKIILAIVIVSVVVGLQLENILSLHLLYPENQVYQVSGMFSTIALQLSLGLGVFGIADVIKQRKQFKEQVYLDYSEMKREYKEQEGDPHLKAHRRAMHQALSRQQLIQNIKKSKVIVVERA